MHDFEGTIVDGIAGMLGSLVNGVLGAAAGGGAGAPKEAAPAANPATGDIASGIAQLVTEGIKMFMGAMQQAEGGAAATQAGAPGSGPASAGDAAAIGATAPTATAGTFANPTLPNNAPDPAVMRADDGIYYAYTTNSDGKNLPVMKSRDMVTWEPAGDALPAKPAWVDKDIWAPQTVKTGDHYTMFFSGRGQDGKMRIGYATSPKPEGPFQDRGVLLESDNPGFTIDPNILQDGGKTYIYWGSADGNKAAGVGGIKGQEIAIKPDGSIDKLGQPQEVKPKLADDRKLVEAPWVVKKGNEYFMFYSDGHFTGEGGNDYSLKVSKSTSPMGPFTEARTVIKGGNGFSNPGHGSIATDDAGNDFAVYHAYQGGTDGPRRMMMDKIEWKDGWPTVAGGVPSSAPQAAPVVGAR